MDKPDPSFLARKAILDAALPIAAFDGWNSKTLREAVAQAELPKGAEELYFPGGALELIAFWGELCDEQVALKLSQMDLSSMKIREKVTQGVLARLQTTSNHEEAARRAVAKLSLPSSAVEGPKVLWAAADTIWRAIGDSSTDSNFYTKRTVLSGVISSTLIAWLADETEDKTEGRAFLDRRIENVMQFEKTKFKMKKASENWPDPVQFISKLRYGARRRRPR